MSFPQYPRYKDSGVAWLGEVPGHWDVVQLKRFVEIQNGADHKQIEQTEGYPVIGSGGVFAYASDFLYDGESVLLGRKGTIDKPLHVTGRFWTVDTMYWTKISPAASGRFAYYAALTIPFDYYSTNTALPSMTKSNLNSHLVSRPPLSEQIAIAAFLDRETAKIDGLIGEQRRLIELLKEKSQSIISHAVTKGLNHNVPLLPSGFDWIGDIPEHWNLPPLYVRYEQVLGKMLDEAKMTGEHPTPYLRNADVRWDHFNVEDLPVMDIKPAERERFMVRRGDLLTVEGRELGRAAIWGRDDHTVAFQKAVHRLRPLNGSEHTRYLYYTLVFANGTDVFFANQSPSEIPHLTGKQLRGYRFPKPPTDEQVAIAEFLDQETRAFDPLLKEARCAIDLLQERRTVLISAAVTGQIDVREQNA